MRSSLDPTQLLRLQPRSVLIVKLSSIGDVVHALPVATALRRHNPHLRITWAVEDWVAPIIVSHRAIDHVVIFPRMRWRSTSAHWSQSISDAVANLRRTSYDVCLDLQGLLKSSVVALLSGAPVRLSAGRQREGAQWVSQAVATDSRRRHVVEQYLQCATALGAAAEPVSFDLQVDPQAAELVDRFLLESGVRVDRPLIVINPSGSAPWKTWPPERWTRVAAALRDLGSVVLVGANPERDRHRVIARADHQPTADLAVCTSLTGLVALLARCTVHIAPDTGSAHMAVALRRPVVGLYGPTAPWRTGPYGEQSSVVYHAGLCSRWCPRMCPRARQCLQAASPDEIVSQARAVLDRSVSNR